MLHWWPLPLCTAFQLMPDKVVVSLCIKWLSYQLRPEFSHFYSFCFCSVVDLHTSQQNTLVSGTPSPPPSWTDWWFRIPIMSILAYNCVNRLIRFWKLFPWMKQSLSRCTVPYILFDLIDCSGRQNVEAGVRRCTALVMAVTCFSPVHGCHMSSLLTTHFPVNLL